MGTGETPVTPREGAGPFSTTPPDLGVQRDASLSARVQKGCPLFTPTTHNMPAGATPPPLQRRECRRDASPSAGVQKGCPFFTPITHNMPAGAPLPVCYNGIDSQRWEVGFGSQDRPGR